MFNTSLVSRALTSATCTQAGSFLHREPAGSPLCADFLCTGTGRDKYGLLLKPSLSFSARRRASESDSLLMSSFGVDWCDCVSYHSGKVSLQISLVSVDLYILTLLLATVRAVTFWGRVLLNRYLCDPWRCQHTFMHALQATPGDQKGCL